MPYKTLPDIFGNMTLRDVLTLSPEEALKDLNPEQRDAFMSVLSKGIFTLEEMGESDAFTEIAFKHPEEGMNEYPPTPNALLKGVTCMTGAPGCIYSRYHLETSLKAHTKLTVGLLDENWRTYYGYGNSDDMVIPLPLLLATTYHDAGKKWCACTNADGEISSFGHAECSAYAVNQCLMELLDEDTRRVIVAAVYGHDLIKRWVPSDDEKVRLYQETVGEEFSGCQNRMIRLYAETIADADAGVKSIELDGAREVKYTITCEHFAKIDGRIEEREKTLTNDELDALMKRGEELIEKAFTALLARAE